MPVQARPTSRQSYILTNLLVGIREGVAGSHDVDIAQISRYFVCSVKFLQSMELESLVMGGEGAEVEGFFFFYTTTKLIR